MKPTNTILGEYGTTIFTVMSALAVEHKAINLGQGFPDTDGPADILAEAERATEE
ncbi:MAG: aminotransferase, partial [Rhodospirillaceae bacterium]|nr:aminotransferase [Rhodospirillaceae bacterium]